MRIDWSLGQVTGKKKNSVRTQTKKTRVCAELSVAWDHLKIGWSVGPDHTKKKHRFPRNYNKKKTVTAACVPNSRRRCASHVVCLSVFAKRAAKFFSQSRTAAKMNYATNQFGVYSIPKRGRTRIVISIKSRLF